MVVLISLFLGIAAMIVSYSLGQGGPVGAMIFLFILFLGAAIHYSKPLIERLRP